MPDGCAIELCLPPHLHCVTERRGSNWGATGGGRHGGDTGREESSKLFLLVKDFEIVVVTKLSKNAVMAFFEKQPLSHGLSGYSASILYIGNHRRDFASRWRCSARCRCAVRTATLCCAVNFKIQNISRMVH